MSRCVMRWHLQSRTWCCYQSISEDEYVELNLEFFRWLNLDSQLVLNEDSDDAWEDKLKVSDEKTSSSISELDSNAGSRQVNESLASNFPLHEVEDEMMLNEDWVQCNQITSSHHAWNLER